MNKSNISEYSYLGLKNHGNPLEVGVTLGYVVGLVDSANHKINETLPAKRILMWLDEVEEQCPDASYLLERQQSFFTRYFPEGYFPQTPVMFTKEWSPISAMLEFGLNPIALARERKTWAVATGIWEPMPIKVSEISNMNECRTVEELFWAVLDEAASRAKQRRMFISVIASPGWNYETKIDSLPKWSKEEVIKADRILWKRTPEDET
jgi:hypothetical protein